MSGLLPSLSERTAAPDSDPRVLPVGGEDFEETLSALSAETTRQLLAAVYDSPGTPSELADEVDTSLQNVSYHVDKLEAAGLVEPIDSVYSEKGHEMTVYGPASDPIVFVGDDDRTGQVERIVAEVAGAVGILALGGLAVQYGVERLIGGDATATGVVGPAGEVPGEGAVGEAIRLTFEVVEPGVLFFLGGLATVVFLLLYSQVVAGRRE